MLEQSRCLPKEYERSGVGFDERKAEQHLWGACLAICWKYVTDIELNFQTNALKQQFPTFLAPGAGFVEDNSSMEAGAMVSGWFRCITILCTLLLLHQLHLRSSGIRSQRLGVPALKEEWFCSLDDEGVEVQGHRGPQMALVPRSVGF